MLTFRDGKLAVMCDKCWVVVMEPPPEDWQSIELAVTNAARGEDIIVVHHFCPDHHLRTVFTQQGADRVEDFGGHATADAAV